MEYQEAQEVAKRVGLILNSVFANDLFDLIQIMGEDILLPSKIRQNLFSIIRNFRTDEKELLQEICRKLYQELSFETMALR